MTNGIYETVLDSYLNQIIVVVWRGRSAIEGMLKENSGHDEPGYVLYATWMGSSIELYFWETGIARLEITGEKLCVYLGPNPAPKEDEDG